MPHLLDARVAGIPCKVRITHFDPGVPASRRGHPDDWSPEEPADFDFEILDRRGRPAPWLERLATDRDLQEISATILETA